MAITPITLDKIDATEFLSMGFTRPIIEVEGALNRGGRKAEHFGEATISGVITRSSIPDDLVVHLYSQATGELVETTKSAPNGAYIFENLSNGKKYFLVALDDQAALDPAARSDVMPE